MAKILRETIQASIEAGTSRTKPTWKSKKWFDEEVWEKRKELSKLGRWGRRKRKEGRPKDEEELRAKKNTYFRKIREKKKDIWNEFVEGATTSEAVWGVWRMSIKGRTQEMPTLKHNGRVHTTFQEKEAILREHLFPRAPESDEKEDPAGKEKRAEVSLEEVQQAFKRAGRLKVPEDDEIVIMAIWETMPLVEQRIRETYETALNNGEHRGEWKRAIGAIIPKPKKPDYTSIKSY